ncbi:MAG: hypothetical protein WA786_02340 [Acidimicrobiales bacterium]
MHKQSARELGKRRRRPATIIVATVVGSLLWTVAPSWAAAKHPHATSVVAPFRLEQPTGMTVAPNGLLFIADQSLNRVLVRFPSGQLETVAGTGLAGFSGDGGLAANAQLNHPGAIALAPNGTIFVADVGNHRVRALLNHGRIATFAGDGASNATTFKVGTKATDVAMSPSGLAIAPDGRLWVTSGENVLELSASGVIVAVVEVSRYSGGPVPFQPCDPESVAVSPSGNLYIGCSGSHQLVERLSNGHDKIILTSYRPHDFPGLAFFKGGALAIANHESLQAVVGNQLTTLFTYKVFGNSQRFVPSGVAISSNGTLYINSQAGDGFTFGAGLAKVTPSNADHLLRYWKEG